MPVGAKPGNQNAAKGRMWRDAIERALAKRSGGDKVKALDDLAEKFLTAVEQGDLQAFKEFGDRMDGKPAQQIVMNGDEDGGPVAISVIERRII